ALLDLERARKRVRVVARLQALHILRDRGDAAERGAAGDRGACSEIRAGQAGEFTAGEAAVRIRRDERRQRSCRYAARRPDIGTLRILLRIDAVVARAEVDSLEEAGIEVVRPVSTHRRVLAFRDEGVVE